MRSLIAVMLGLAALLGAGLLFFFFQDDHGVAPPHETHAVDVARDEAAIREVIARMEAANNEGDVDAWVGQFAPHAVYMPPGSPAVTTRAGLREIAETGFTQARTDVALTPVEVEVEGDSAFARVDVEGTATVLEDGSTIAIDMKELVVLGRQPDGAWRIRRMIANRNAH